MSDKIELSTLHEVAYNPRTISDEHLENLKDSIKEYTDTRGSGDDGYRLTTTVTINSNGNRIVGGHQRIKALKSLGQSWISEDDITWVKLEVDSSEEKALNITLNSEKFQGDWNIEQLDILLSQIYYPDLIDDEVDFDESIQEAATIKKLTKKEEKVEIDEAFGVGSQFVREMDVTQYVVPEDQGELTSVSHSVDSQQRTDIIKSVMFVKSKYGFKTDVEALTKVCEEYMALV